MKWWKKLCAAALALSMPVLASAGISFIVNFIRYDKLV